MCYTLIAMGGKEPEVQCFMGAASCLGIYHIVPCNERTGHFGMVFFLFVH